MELQKKFLNLNLFLLEIFNFLEKSIDVHNETKNKYIRSNLKCLQEPNIIISQVKEKYGTLRFYWFTSFNTIETDRDEIDIVTMKEKEEVSNLINELHDVVSKYEVKSESVCEKCGNKGKLRDDLRWIRTLCKSCYLEEKIIGSVNLK